MTLCLVTDRRRLVPAGAPESVAVRCLLAQVRHACEAGVDLVQVRERDLHGAPLRDLVARILVFARGSRTRVVVNDRLDVALACGADGVHLRGDSIPVAAVRRIAPAPFVVGRSIHGIGELAAAEGADYLIAGTVFSSTSKPDSHPLLGVDGLRAIARAASAPVIAIGGITLERIGDAAAAGARGAAAIGLFMREADRSRGCGACPLEAIVADARGRFDSAISRP